MSENKWKKRIHYVLKAAKHFGDETYMDFFLEREVNPLLLEFKQNGSGVPDKKVMLIRENGKGWGFFAEVRAMLAKMVFAERFGLMPYVEWGSAFLYTEKQSVNGTQNAFEYYFRQPNGMTKQDVLESSYVTESKSAQGVVIEREFKRDTYEMTAEYQSKLAEMYRKYIRLNEKTEKMIQNDLKDIFDDGKILGVHFRGTDYKAGYQNHPVAVQIEQTIAQVKNCLEENTFQKIFLATDEKNAVERFEREFPGKVFYFQDVYRGEGNTSIAFSRSDRPEHHYRLGYEVLRDMYALAACDGLVAGLSQVVNCARIVKKSSGKEYDTLCIINNGINVNGKQFAK